MNCENVFCVYNKEGGCIVEPSIGISGFCDSCVYIDIEKEKLAEIKEKMLSAWNEQDENEV